MDSIWCVCVLSVTLISETFLLSIYFSIKHSLFKTVTHSHGAFAMNYQSRPRAREAKIETCHKTHKQKFVNCIFEDFEPLPQF